MVSKSTAQERAQTELDRAQRLLERAGKKVDVLRGQLTVAEVELDSARRRWEYAGANPDLKPAEESVQTFHPMDSTMQSAAVSSDG